MRTNGEHILSNDDYHADKDYLSSSGIKVALDKALYGYIVMEGNGEDKSSSSMELGNLIHTMLLEPEKYEEEYYLYTGPTNKDGTVPKKHQTEEFLEASKGKQVISQQHLDLANRARQNVLKYDKANELMFGSNGKNEMSYFYTDNEIVKELTKGEKDFPLHFRVRPDRIILDLENKTGKIIDVKSSRNIRYHAFKNDVKYNFKYDLSAVMYIYVIYKLYGIICDFDWLVVGSNDWAPVAVYPMGEETYAHGESQFHKALLNIIHCKETGEWNYQDKPQVM